MRFMTVVRKMIREDKRGEAKISHAIDVLKMGIEQMWLVGLSEKEIKDWVKETIKEQKELDTLK